MTTTDDLRRALAERAQSVAVPEPVGVDVIRQRAQVARLRTATTILTATLLVTGVAAAIGLPSSSRGSSLVDTRLGAPATTTSTAPGDPGAPGGGTGAADEQDGDGAGASSGGGDGGDGSGAPASSTTTVVPSDAGPVEVTHAPPAPRQAGDPTYALADPGSWLYRVEGRRNRPDVTGNRDIVDEPYLKVEAPQGRTQVTDGHTSRFGYFSVRDATRTLDRSVTLQEVTLWGSDFIDTAKTFRLPAGTLDVPAKADWGTPWSYAATSVDGTTHLQVSSKVEGTELLVMPGRDGEHTSVWCVVVHSTVEASGDRSLVATRTIWWAIDYGVMAKIHETVSGTSSTGAAVETDLTGTLVEAKSSPAPIYRQVQEDAGVGG
jgi:hypothetical protein